MRIWLDLNKLTRVGLTPVDVVDALQGQNVQVAAGQLGDTPAVPDQMLTATFLAIFMIPMFFVAIREKFSRTSTRIQKESPENTPAQ